MERIGVAPISSQNYEGSGATGRGGKGWDISVVVVCSGL